MTTQFTGREPRLSAAYSRRGERRLSLRGLANMLNTLPPEQISPEVAEAALRSAAFFVRYNAAVMLAKRADREARLVMQRVLSDGSPPSRATVARHLHSFSWFAAEPLIGQALADSDSRVREGAVYALCDMNEINAYRLLTEALQNETDNVRAAAAWGLRECGDPAAVPVLEVVLQAQDPDVRVQAFEALGANGSPQAVVVTLPGLHDPEPEVKYAATLSLLELIGEGALPELASLIRRMEGRARAAILRGLFHATNYLGIDIMADDSAERVIEALEEALHDNLPDTRMAAIWPLAWIRHARTPDILRAAYEAETDEQVKAHIVRVAVSLMNDAGEDLLHDALNSPMERVREVARQIERERAGHPIARYDESDDQRHGLSTPHLRD